MIQRLPKQYWLRVQSLSEGNLDQLYKDGWRAVHMVLHPDGDSVILLLERTAPKK
jgi:hypothetical protein